MNTEILYGKNRISLGICFHSLPSIGVKIFLGIGRMEILILTDLDNRIIKYYKGHSFFTETNLN